MPHRAPSLVTVLLPVVLATACSTDRPLQQPLTQSATPVVAALAISDIVPAEPMMLQVGGLADGTRVSFVVSLRGPVSWNVAPRPVGQKCPQAR